MKRSLILLPFALAACHKGDTVTNATANQADATATANGTTVTLSAGHWDLSSTVSDIQVPGVPAAELAAQRQRFSAPKTTSKCVTPEQAAKPASSFFAPASSAATCTFDHFTMAGGKLDFAQTCHLGPATQHTSATGTYSADAMHLEISSAGEGGGGPAGMVVKATMDGKHNGACTGQEEAAAQPAGAAAPAGEAGNAAGAE